MTDTEKMQRAYALLINRYAQAVDGLLAQQVLVEAEKARADALQARLDALAPKDAAAAE